MTEITQKGSVAFNVTACHNIINIPKSSICVDNYQSKVYYKIYFPVIYLIFITFEIENNNIEL